MATTGSRSQRFSGWMTSSLLEKAAGNDVEPTELLDSAAIPASDVWSNHPGRAATPSAAAAARWDAGRKLTSLEAVSMGPRATRRGQPVRGTPSRRAPRIAGDNRASRPAHYSDEVLAAWAAGQRRQHHTHRALSWRWLAYALLVGPLILMALVVSASARLMLPSSVAVWGFQQREAARRYLLAVATIVGVALALTLSIAPLWERTQRAPKAVQPSPITAASNRREGPPAATPAMGSTTSPSAVTKWVEIAHTDNDGLYLRRRPVWSARWASWPEGTRLQVLAWTVPGGGPTPGSTETWLRVRDPVGRVGYVPQRYVLIPASGGWPHPRGPSPPLMERG